MTVFIRPLHSAMFSQNESDKMSKSEKYTGFTLVEVLVCLGVIALLSAIVIPVTAKVREKSRQATCSSNLHQWGIAFQVYVADYDGYYPRPAEDWGGQEAFDIDKITLCPSFSYDKSDDRTRIDAETIGYGRTGYQYNANLTGGLPDGLYSITKPVNEHRILYPSNTLLLMDGGSNTFYGHLNGNFLARLRKAMLLNLALKQQWERHQGGGNFLFCDGHVKWMKQENISVDDLVNDGVHPTFALDNIIPMRRK
jgi:prepilin-type processing-associated H-X9-DG protein/prepilin-type N-terminal cleavage/methylation domain-containing protein